MDPDAPIREVSREPAEDAGLLGQLLYAGAAQAPVPESEWVRLVRSMAAGDQSALQALYERAHRLVYTLSLRITRNRETAEEVTLDVFHDLWTRAAEYDPRGGPVLGWIMNQARSRAIDRSRFDGRKKRTSAPARGAFPAAAHHQPFDELQSRDQGRVLREALGLLTEGEREAIETAYFSELTYGETAARLDQPLGTIKTRIRSALEKLRLALSARRGEL